MRSIITYFFPGLCRQPQVGDQYIHIDHVTNDPFADTGPMIYTVKDIKRGYALCVYGSLDSTRSIEIGDLIAFYQLHKPSSL